MKLIFFSFRDSCVVCVSVWWPLHLNNSIQERERNRNIMDRCHSRKPFSRLGRVTCVIANQTPGSSGRIHPLYKVLKLLVSFMVRCLLDTLVRGFEQILVWSSVILWNFPHVGLLSNKTTILFPRRFHFLCILKIQSKQNIHFDKRYHEKPLSKHDIAVQRH